MQHISVKVDSLHPINALNQIVGALKPRWMTEGFTYKEFHGGLVNNIFCCHLESDSELDDAIVVKVFPDLHYTRYMGMPVEEWRMVSQIAEKLGCGPRVMASFENGIIYKYVKGSTLTRQMMRQEHIMRKVTKLLAKIHAEEFDENSVPSNRISQKRHFIEKQRNLLDYIPEDDDRGTIENYPRGDHFKKSRIKEEFEFIVKFLDDLKLKTVLSHGDFHCYNIVYNGEEDSLTLVDYDLTFHNYEAYDLSHLYFEYKYMAVFGVKVEDDPGDYDDDVMRKWITCYLEAKADQKGQSRNNITKTQVEMMLLECKMINTYVHLMVLIYSLANLTNPVLNFVSPSTAIFAYGNYETDKKKLDGFREEYLALKAKETG